MPYTYGKKYMHLYEHCSGCKIISKQKIELCFIGYEIKRLYKYSKIKKVKKIFKDKES